MKTVRPVDAMDSIIQEGNDWLKQLIIFLHEKKYNLLVLQDMIAKPYKYVNEFNEFLRHQKSHFMVSEN